MILKVFWLCLSQQNCKRKRCFYTNSAWLTWKHLSWSPFQVDSQKTSPPPSAFQNSFLLNINNSISKDNLYLYERLWWLGLDLDLYYIVVVRKRTDFNVEYKHNNNVFEISSEFEKRHQNNMRVTVTVTITIFCCFYH